MTARLPDLESTDQRLREWGWFFRDRRRLEHCKSIEHRFRAQSEDFAAEGWGDMDAAPSVRPAQAWNLLRALEVHEAISELDRVYRWCLTYGYCYPSLPRFVVLRSIKRFTGRRMNWQTYMDTLDIGRVRVHTAISWTRQLTA